MDVIFWFNFGPVHVPLGRRNWTDGPEFKITENGREYVLRMFRPKRINTHFLNEETEDQKVVDALIPIAVGCELVDNAVGYREVAEVALAYLGPIVENSRVRTRQANLQVRRIADLAAVEVTDSDTEEIPELTQKFRQWMMKQELDRSLPWIDFEEWNQLQSDVITNDDFSEWASERRPPLYESLLLDAELESQSDSRVAILFAALACDIFIQSWLENSAAIDARIKKWLEWTTRSGSEGGRVSFTGSFDISLQLAEGRSLKEHKQLWKKLGALNKARNDVAHRGRHSPNYTPEQAIETATAVIDWVKGYEQSELPDQRAD